MLQTRQKGWEQGWHGLLIANLLKSYFENITLGLLLLLFELGQSVKKLPGEARLEAETPPGQVFEFNANQTAKEIFKQDRIFSVAEQDC